jgi:hypothetical protein
MVSWVLKLSFGTLTGWDKGFDEHMRAYRIVDRRGTSGKVTVEVVRQVVDKARALKARNKRLRVKEFTRDVNRDLRLNLGCKTVQDVLIANDLWKTRTRQTRPRFYQGLCQRIPNGLLSLDGSEFVVWIDDEALKFNVELGVDVGSFCHTGFDISRTETSDAVISVLEQHRRNFGVSLGVVFDHGRANLSSEVRAYLKAHDIEIVPAGPANPKGNGTDEGAFSQMKKTIDTIRLDTSSPEALGKGILEAIVALYVKMRNQMALRKNRAVPLTKMQAPVSDVQRHIERERLLAHKQRKKAAEADQPKLDRLRWTIDHYGLVPEAAALRRAEHCIRYYDLEAITLSEKAFLKALNRDPNRLSLAYFFGILRNIQQELDDGRYQDYCRQRYNYELMQETERRLEEQQQAQGPPTVKSIVDMAAIAVSLSAQFLKDSALKRLKEWTRELLKSSRYIGPVRRKIIDAIGALKDLEKTRKEQIWQLLEQFINQKPKGEGVTQIS